MTNLKAKFLVIAPNLADHKINYIYIVDGELCTSSEYELNLTRAEEYEILTQLEAA